MRKVNQKGVIQVAVVLILLAGVAGGVYLVNRGEPLKWLPQAFNGRPLPLIKSISGPIGCSQVITLAKKVASGGADECREFPTPCDVPAGWQKVDKCAPPLGTPLSCIACNADLNKDGVVNNSDIAQMTNCVNGKTKGLLCSNMDFSGNGVVDQKDLQCPRSVYNQKCSKGFLKR